MFACCRCTNNAKKNDKVPKKENQKSATTEIVNETETNQSSANKSNETETGEDLSKPPSSSLLNGNADKENNPPTPSPDESKVENRLTNGHSSESETENNNPPSITDMEVSKIIETTETELAQDIEQKSNGTVQNESDISKQSANHETICSTDSHDNTCDRVPPISPRFTEQSPPNTALTTKSLNDARPKSCLSRHNSRSSIKKRVNINNSTEIITTPELPSIDDDEVFSDSMPPQKRENMCAPYIENGGNGKQGRFGLPDWFNEERFNDIFVDPPITPVGKDELELRRHRLYSDLLIAAQAAVDNRVRFDPITPAIVSEDCDPNLKPSVARDLESLLNRLELLVERLERSVSARELEIANKTFETILEKKRNSFDLESTDLPPIPNSESLADGQEEINQNFQAESKLLDERIERIENSLSKLNDSKENSSIIDDSFENIPTTVLEEYQIDDEYSSLPPPPPPITDTMSAESYEDTLKSSLIDYLRLSRELQADIVVAHSLLVKAAFDAQAAFMAYAKQSAKPSQEKQADLLKPTSEAIKAVQVFRETNRGSPFFNHLSAISESIPALGWVCIAPTPGPHVKEMIDAAHFYTNRVINDFKDKDSKHVNWARSWIDVLNALHRYIKQYHTTGLVWSGKSGVPPPPPSLAGCPPPPPPPAFDLATLSLNDGTADERSALFAEINQGEGITRNLKKVTADMQTHKNPTLRTGPAPFKAPQQFSQTSAKPVVTAPTTTKEPVFTRDGKKWIIEYQVSNPNLLVENAEMNNVIYVYKCEKSTLQVKGKVNNIVLDSCKKCSLLFDSVVSSVEFVNCQSMQMQVLGSVPTVSIDKTDGCQMYLSSNSLGVAIISSKSSEMNVLIPKPNGEFSEQAIPEQFRTTIKGNTIHTVCVESVG